MIYVVNFNASNFFGTHAVIQQLPKFDWLKQLFVGAPTLYNVDQTYVVDAEVFSAVMYVAHAADCLGDVMVATAMGYSPLDLASLPVIRKSDKAGLDEELCKVLKLAEQIRKCRHMINDALDGGETVHIDGLELDREAFVEMLRATRQVAHKKLSAMLTQI